MKNILTTGIFAAIAMTGIRYAADKGATGAEAKDPAAPKDSPISKAHPVVDTQAIELKKLVIDAGTQPRVAIDDEVVKEYTEVVKLCLKNEQPIPFPPITVFRDSTGRCIVADGFHRYAGHKNGKAHEILCEIREGDERDALLFSCGANATHGVRRTNKDKAKAIKTVLSDPEWTQYANTEIARVCGVSEFMVREMRSAFKSPTARKTIRGGKTSVIDTSAIGKGKGGGVKAKKDEARKAGKKGKELLAMASNGKPATANAAQELDKLLENIAVAVGGEEGGKIRKAVNDGSLSLAPKDIKDWAGFAPKDIKNLAPLITGGNRMKPSKAFDFVKEELSPKVVTDLHNRAIGNGGTFVYEGDGVVITVKHKAK